MKTDKNNIMKGAYKKISKIVNDTYSISLSEDHGDCDDKVSKFLIEEAKLQSIIKVLIEHGYVSENHRIFPEYTS
jgi:hypothetical protein